MVVLSSSVDVVMLFISESLYLASLYVAFYAMVLSYVIVFVGGFLRGRLNIIYEKIWISIGLINFSIDFICYKIFKMGFNQDMIGIIRATNIQEAKEFISMYFSWSSVTWLLVMIFIIIYLKEIISRINLCKVCQIIGFFIVIVGAAVANVKESSLLNRVFLRKVGSLITYELPPKLTTFYSEFELNDIRETDIPNVVVIFGESFSKSHSSLYGYGKITNPALSKLKEDTMLYVYENVSAPATNTISCFKQFMSTYDSSSQEAWYKHRTIIEMLRKSGYNTFWISNQSQKGGYDNIVARYAELCDTMFWVGNRFQGVNRTSYDEEILPILKDIKSNSLKKDKKKRTFFIHLMGSHYTFDKRFPKDFMQFKESDYLDLKQGQRKNISLYDNSILYNDYVVNEIVNLFREDNVIIFYFSDHGLDLYNSSDVYIGHANSHPISIKSALSIPFMIYISKEFEEKNKYISDRIKKCVGIEWNTAYFPYLIMDVIGKDFGDSIVLKHSPFREIKIRG